MSFVRGQAATFYTNCFKFDGQIAQNLHDNPKFSTNLSIDAGTPQTWRKVKGRIILKRSWEISSNIIQKSAGGGQIILKHIVLPGINDTWEDDSSFMEIIRIWKVSHSELSRNTTYMHTMCSEERGTLSGALAYLIALCKKNGIEYIHSYFTPEEQSCAEKLSNEILQRGLFPGCSSVWTPGTRFVGESVLPRLAPEPAQIRRTIYFFQQKSCRSRGSFFRLFGEVSRGRWSV